MLFSSKWLARYVDLPGSPAELSDLLTRCGMVVEEARPHGGDTVLDLDVPTNRVDAMNHFGVAREIATARRTDLRPPGAVSGTSGPAGSGSASPADGATAAAALASVQIDDFAGCPRYVARVVCGVKVAPSPAWLTALLEAIGLRPLNNIADITNFVLWELGHPLHAFDLDRLAGQCIVVRRARAGESLTTLDGAARKLMETDVVIADAERPVALAGVMGGLDSEITDDTRNVLLEGASFDPRAVRATAQRLHLHTDASHRFERSPAPDGMLGALDRCAALIVEIAGGELAGGRIDVFDTLPSPVSLGLRASRLRGLLGIDVADNDVTDILGRLGFALEAGNGGWQVGVPSGRPDVRREEDLIEEVGRHVGYDRLPATLPAIRSAGEAGTPEVLGERRLKQCLVAAGCNEAMSSSLSAAGPQAAFLAAGETPVALSNPISENLGVLRAHLVPGLLAAVAHNLNHGLTSLRLFEVGRRFRGPLTDKGVSERWGLAVALVGARHAPHWDGDAGVVDFYDLKGLVDDIARQMAWPAWRWTPGAQPGLDPSATASVGARGWAGRLSAQTAVAFGIDAEVWVAELDVDDLLPRPHPTARYAAVSRFPGGTRDVALVVPEAVRYAQIEAAVAAAAAGARLPLVATGLVEVYEGDEIPAGQRGLTVRFHFRADDRTLTADDIDAAQQALVEALMTGVGAARR